MKHISEHEQHPPDNSDTTARGALTCVGLTTDLLIIISQFAEGKQKNQTKLLRCFHGEIRSEISVNEMLKIATRTGVEEGHESFSVIERINMRNVLP